MEDHGDGVPPFSLPTRSRSNHAPPDLDVLIPAGCRRSLLRLSTEDVPKEELRPSISRRALCFPLGPVCLDHGRQEVRR
jgi:hypothetical protein